MPSSISDLRSRFSGYRSNRFKIEGMLPAGLLDATNLDILDIEFYVKAAQVPGAAVGYVPLNYRGRNVKFPAERTFNDWGVQIYPSSEQPQDLRLLFATWIQLMNSGSHDVMDYELVAPQWTIYFNDITNQQSAPLNYKNAVTMYNCFPIEISPMEMNNDITDAFAEFTLTIAYDYTEEKQKSFGGGSPILGDNTTNVNIARA